MNTSKLLWITPQIDCKLIQHSSSCANALLRFIRHTNQQSLCVAFILFPCMRWQYRLFLLQQREFINRTVKELEQVGAIYKNPTARWASPALAVPKPGSGQLRFTVDLRGPNSMTVKITSAMPHLESKFQDVAGSTCFVSCDLAHGYWQIPLAAESQEMLSIQTPRGVFSSRRLLQDGSDSGNHFQAVLGHRFSGRVDKMLQ